MLKMLFTSFTPLLKPKCHKTMQSLLRSPSLKNVALTTLETFTSCRYYSNLQSTHCSSIWYCNQPCASATFTPQLQSPAVLVQCILSSHQPKCAFSHLPKYQTSSRPAEPIRSVAYELALARNGLFWVQTYCYLADQSCYI